MEKILFGKNYKLKSSLTTATIAFTHYQNTFNNLIHITTFKTSSFKTHKKKEDIFCIRNIISIFAPGNRTEVVTSYKNSAKR